MSETASPLQWPSGRPRATDRVASAFRLTPRAALDELVAEMAKHSDGSVASVISSNAALRRDGLPYAEALTEAHEDPGVAVYLTRKGRRVCVACDTYTTVWENMRAIGLTLEHLRAIGRYGAAELADRAFTGFAALPPPDAGWGAVLALDETTATAEDVARAHRALARSAAGARDNERLQRLNVARDDALGAIALRIVPP